MKEQKAYIVWVIVSRRGVPQGELTFNRKRDALVELRSSHRYRGCRVECALLSVPFPGPTP